MPMSATGCCKRAPLLIPSQRISGFTLIEILVALVIVGVLASSVVLTLPDTALAQRRASVHAWLAQAETAALRAEAQATPFAWQISERQAQLLVLEGDQWHAPAASIASPLALAEGLAVDHLENDGQRLPLGSRILFAGSPPLFVVKISGHGRRWQLDGQPNGTITLVETP